MKKFYIEVKFSSGYHGRKKDTFVFKSKNSVLAIIITIKKVRDLDPDCEISEIIVKTKP